MSVSLRYSFKALSGIESANPHSTIFTVLIAGIESAILIIRIIIVYPLHDNNTRYYSTYITFPTCTHPFTPGLIKDPVVKPLSLSPNNMSTTELMSCEADTTSDYFSASGGSTPSSHSRSQSLVGCELLGCTEDDGDCFSEPSCDSEDEWEQLDRQLQLLEERRGSAPLLPQTSSWHRYIPQCCLLAKTVSFPFANCLREVGNKEAFHDLLSIWDSGVLPIPQTSTVTIIQRKQLCTLETIFSL